MEKLLLSFLYKNGIYNLDEKDIKLQLYSHNEYPSLRAITDTLDYFGIENIAANVPTNVFEQLPKFFLALVNLESGTELTLATKNKSYVILKTIAGKKLRISNENFSEKWTGTLIAIEVTEKERSNSLFHVSSETLIITLLLITALCTTLFNDFTFLKAGYLLLSIIGITISYLVVKESLGIKDALTAKICGTISKTNNECSTVINSEEGKLFGKIALGDLSIGYFTVVFLSGLLISNSYSLLFILAILSLPFIAYTIAIQAFKLKTFCLLCLTLSTLLLSQFAILFFQFTNWDFSFSAISGFVFIAAFVFGIGSILKKFWKDSLQLDQTEHDFLRFRRNEKFFATAYEAMPSYAFDSFNLANTISFGKKNAPIKIQAITNPFCGFCKVPFDTYMSLIEKYPNDIELQLIFNVSNDPENEAAKLTLKVLDLYTTQPDYALIALRDWFDNRNYKSWEKKYHPTKESIRYLPILEEHLNWCLKNDIHYTPETLINGKAFPKSEYNISDISLFIETLKETTLIEA